MLILCCVRIVYVKNIAAVLTQICKIGKDDNRDNIVTIIIQFFVTNFKSSFMKRARTVQLYVH